ncbi:transposase family protein [Myxococcota bacterium]
MEKRATLRQIAGFLRARLDELGLDEVKDPRSNQGKRWKLEQVLTVVLLGLMAGCKGLTELEELSGDTRGVMRRWLDVPRRLPDTTARSILCRLDSKELIPLLHRLVIAGHHRGAWAAVDDMPFGIAAMDGKGTSLPVWSGKFAQRHNPKEGIPYGVLRTVTSTLVTSRSVGCIDISPVPAVNNEMSHFAAAFESLVNNHASRFEMVSYDQGANSEENAKFVLSKGKHYLFRLNDERRHMQQLAQELLATREVSFRDVEINSRGEQVTRTLRLIRVNRGVLPELPRKSELWLHTKTLLQVEAETEHSDHRVTMERRYFASSLAAECLTAEQWLRAVKWHWRVETSHQILDTAFGEDERPWIRADPNGMLVMMILRRIAYTLLGLFRSVTQRSEEKHQMAWRRLLKQVNNTLISADESTVAGLRRRPRRKKRTRKARTGSAHFPIRAAA